VLISQAALGQTSVASRRSERNGSIENVQVLIERRRILITGATALLGAVAGGGYLLMPRTRQVPLQDADHVRIVQAPAALLPAPSRATDGHEIPVIATSALDERVEDQLVNAAAADRAGSRQRMIERRRQAASDVQPTIQAGASNGEEAWAP
jgi:hypothetical protein